MNNNIMPITDTDKFDLGYIEHVYADFLSDPNKIESIKQILEIGVYNGESILLWKNIFVNATIYAIDINSCDKILNVDRINFIRQNAYCIDCCNIFEDESLDLIIDDGPHTLDSFIFLIKNYLVKLKIGGTLIIEDIIDTSWTPILLNILNTHQIKNKTSVIDMKLKQKTPYLYNRWKNGLDVLVIERVQ
jgi:23S rRNA U2552 (ribose-2'-O)-methylase RlmE/FtsJ